MKTPSFFKAKSRIGLKNKPIHQGELNLGVEDGPEAILSPDFLSGFPDSNVAEFEFPKPEDIPEAKFNQILTQSIKDFALVLSRGSTPEAEETHIQVVVGGDHSVVLGSILAYLDRGINPKNFGVLHIDSHGDINLSKDSPTSNFHGMYLRPLFDKFDIPEIEALVPQKIPTENLMMIGNLDLDPEEEKFLDEHRIHRCRSSDLFSERSDLNSWVNQFEHLHVSFDIDSMDKTIAPATGIPAEQGLSWEDLEPILEIIKKHGNFSFDLCEVNPKKSGGEKTVKLAQDILHYILDN